MRAAAFDNLRAFARALVHEIRTPLSVISNELYYVRSLLPEQETMVASERCSEIANLLKSISAQVAAPLTLEQLTLEAVFRECFPAGTVAEGTRAVPFLGDKARLCYALTALNSLLQGTLQPHLRCDNSFQIVALPFTFAALSSKQAPRTTLDSVQELFCHYLDRTDLAPPLVDAILWAHGAIVGLKFGIPDIVEVSFPLRHE